MMTDTRGQGARNVPAAATLNAMDPEAFAQFVRDSLGGDTDPAIWDVLTEPSVIARTKNYLGSLHADVLAQLSQANSELVIRGEGGKQEFFDAKAEQAEWRRRTAGFRRIVERRLAFVKSCVASITAAKPASPPGLTKTARKHNRVALETLARAVAEHRRRVTSGDGDESDDEKLWRCLTDVTAMVRAGEELPLVEWLEYLDDLREDDDA